MLQGQLLHQLHEHPHNLLPSTITPRAVNGNTLRPIGKISIKVSLGSQALTDELHIHPNVVSTLLSWKVAKALTILPEHYPPLPTSHNTTAPTLSFFDLDQPTCLCTAASRQGLGFILQQKCGDHCTLIQAGSRFLSDTESRYAIIELELLAVSWAITKCKLFLAGLPHFMVVTDHHPLIPILNNHRLDEIENPCLQRLKSSIMAYNFTTQWVKGTQNNAPDALSRNPVSNPFPHDLMAESDPHNNPEPSISEIRAMCTGHLNSLRLENLRKHADSDQEYQQIQHYVRNGFPDHCHRLPEQCQRYWNIRSQLSLDDDLVVFGCRLLIPSAMRPQVLQELHSSHQGAVRTKQRAKLAVYWPGINNDIGNVILTCKQCQDSLPLLPKEPLTGKPRPSRPFQELAVDFCSYAGRDFLIIVDCHTDWPDIIHMGHNTTTSRLIIALLNAFCRTGAPDIIWSDNGTQFIFKLFQQFSNDWGFRHIISSPMYLQSNGKAEATVKSMKKIIQASWRRSTLDERKLTRVLLQYRNMLSQRDGVSPAQKLFGKPMQDTLPAHRRAFAPQWQASAGDAEKHAVTHKERVEHYYNQHAWSLPEIQVGSSVAIQNTITKLWDIYGIVTMIGPHCRYHIKTASGRVLIRNRRYIHCRIALALPGPTSATPQSPQATNFDPCSPPQPPPLHTSTEMLNPPAHKGQTDWQRRSPSPRNPKVKVQRGRGDVEDTRTIPNSEYCMLDNMHS